MPAANSIDEVIDALTGIIGQARTEKSRLGYFPALYRRVTRAVKDGIASGRFEDGARMEQLDVVFANRYLAAYDTWRTGRMASQCWMLAFGAAARTDRAIIQHLLAGMNAHINLDLAVAAAEVAPGAAIATLQHDFQEINQILSEQIDSVQAAIASVAPLMWMLETVGGKEEEWLVAFSLAKARDAAWMQANLLANEAAESRAMTMSVLDAGVTTIGAGVLDPPGYLVRTTLQMVVRGETQDVARVIDALQ
jgi:hypothetical protein